jgi:hypothetical protein
VFFTCGLVLSRINANDINQTYTPLPLNRSDVVDHDPIRIRLDWVRHEAQSAQSKDG